MIENKPLVSISVVTYQHAPYIRQCLDSILMQNTTFPFEIILGEDESFDGTREICLEYAKNHPDKIKLFLRSRKDVIYINGRPTGRFNMIENLKAASGKYIALCEGDDYWTDPLKLQKQINGLEKNIDCMFSFHKAYLIDSKNELKSSNIFPIGINKQKLNELEYLNIPTSATSSLIFRNTDLKVLKSLYHSHGDFLIYCELLEKGKALYIDDVMSVYRKHAGNITRDIITLNYILKRIEELQIEKKYFTNKKIKKAIKKKIVGRVIKAKLIHNNKLDYEANKYLNKIAYTSIIYLNFRLKYFLKRGLNKIKRSLYG